MGLTPAPRVTVIIATYNWSTVLPYSIGSVLDQTFTDFELLVVGDGCTDDSGAVVSAIPDPRVRWINLPARSGHQFGPNNEGLRQARGELIAYLGHDDLMMPHHLASAVEALREGVDLVHPVVARIGPAGTEVRPYILSPRPDAWLPPSGLVHRRTVTDTVGPFRDFRELSEPPEAELLGRAHSAGFVLAFIPRLSIIKFPAAIRPNVYRLRPCAQQAEWLARIRTDPMLEVVELARIVAQLGRLYEGSVLLRALRMARVFRPAYWLDRWQRRKGGRIRANQAINGANSEGVDDVARRGQGRSGRNE